MNTILTEEQTNYLISIGVPKEYASIKEDRNGPALFTLNDILSLLPPIVWNYDIEGYMLLSMNYEDNKWHASYIEEYYELHKWVLSFSKEELIDSLYELLVWLIKKNYLTFDN